MPPTTRRAAMLALAPSLAAFTTFPVTAAEPPPPPGPRLTGTYALPDGQAKVAATLAATPKPGGQAGVQVLDVAMTRLGTGRPVTRFETELSKQLHLIAVSGDLRAFVHGHGDKPDARGHFRVPMAFPHGGLWHVYADAVPAGLGQQVVRFELDVPGDLGGATPGAQPVPAPQPTGLEGADGRYGVRFDALDLRAGQEAELRLHLLRDGQPAPDVTPYLGVAAHAVFIGAADLTYVHAHAAPTAAPVAGGTGAAMTHDMTGTAGTDMPGTGHAGGGGHGGMPGVGGAPMRRGTRVSPDLTLHVRAPEAGTYLLWLQFTAGGQVRTVPFAVAVA